MVDACQESDTLRNPGILQIIPTSSALSPSRLSFKLYHSEVHSPQFQTPVLHAIILTLSSQIMTRRICDTTLVTDWTSSLRMSRRFLAVDVVSPVVRRSCLKDCSPFFVGLLAAVWTHENAGLDTRMCASERSLALVLQERPPKFTGCRSSICSFNRHSANNNGAAQAALHPHSYVMSIQSSSVYVSRNATDELFLKPRLLCDGQRG